MSRRFVVVGAVVLASCIAGCGGSSHNATSSGTSSAGAAPPASVPLPPGASPALRGVFGRVLTAGEMQGWVPRGARVLGVNASSWVAELNLPPAQRAAETARLERLGFAGAVAERLIRSSGGPGEVVSIVVGFQSPSAARADLAREAHAVKSHGVSAEAIPELIPGGVGYVRTSLPSSYVYLFFAKGPYFYSLSGNHPFGRLNPPNLFNLIGAANHQYARVQR